LTEAKIIALERKVGQLILVLEVLKRDRRHVSCGRARNSSIIGGPKAASTDGVRSDIQDEFAG